MKRSKSSNGSSKKQCEALSLGSDFMKNCNVYIQQGGSITRSRADIFLKQIKQYGGDVSTVITKTTTHLIVDDAMIWDKLCRIMKWESPEYVSELKILKSQWLSNCFKNKQLISTETFEVIRSNVKNVDTTITKEEESLQIINKPQMITGNHSGYSAKKIGFVCAAPSGTTHNLNKHITDKLETLAETYKNTKDQWRALGYEKAINTLKKIPKMITTYEEAKNLPGIGERLASKISEIIESGELRKLDCLSNDERITAVNLFTQIWGAGPTTAEMWVQQGLRSLDDLKSKGKLTRQQQIGLKHYDDILEKMPRQEAFEIIETVKKEALSINPGLEMIGCGSFRRGRDMCGDVDILITDFKEDPQVNIISKLIVNLHKSGFLTDDLVSPDGSETIRSKYMGVCRLPGLNRKHRRLDLFVVPSTEFAPALLTYTGSAHFNRSMRLLAKKKGMSLTDQALLEGVVRKGQDKIHGGHPVATPTEESIFKYLGIDYRTPEERDH